jgi:hypothetical protein
MNFMKLLKIPGLIAAVTLTAISTLSVFSQSPPTTGSLPPPNLGDAPKAPAAVSHLPGGGLRPLEVTGGFNVNADSREQVREFYNAIYASSEGVAMNSTADTANCIPGTNATAFQNATLCRINWLRAMAGIPAAVTFSASESTQDQAAAQIMSKNNALQHIGIPPSWGCFTVAGTNAAANSNLALGSDGADAITSYIWDFGLNNTAVGHRRWILYPQTRVMAAGDVPAEGSFNSANATWVFDANFGGPRPATTKPYVAWPPEGFAPYALVFPQWSFALSDADFSAATVTMKSNGVPVSVALQPYQTGYGEDTLVWVPMGLDATSQATTFPFSGTDTVYSVTVTNIKVSASTVGFTYSVTLFDPAVPGTDYVATIVIGTNTPYLNTSNAYACVPIANPNTTGYQWLTAQTTNGNFTENATTDFASETLSNFTALSNPNYLIITNAPDGSGPCIHFVHNQFNTTPQIIRCKKALLPATNTVLSFKSLLGYAFTNEVARVQVSTDGGANWQDLFLDAGCNPPGTSSYTECETTFTPHSLSLSNYAGKLTLLRFNYDFLSPYNYFIGADNYLGWSVENIVVTNVQQAINLATNSTASTNFTFTPTQPGTNVLAAAPVLFTQFSLGWGPFKQVTVVTNPSPVIVLGQPVLTNNQILLNFTISGAASTFHLLHATQLNTAWTTNSTATFTTNIPGSSYRYTATNNAPFRFYRVQTP